MWYQNSKPGCGCLTVLGGLIVLLLAPKVGRVLRDPERNIRKGA